MSFTEPELRPRSNNSRHARSYCTTSQCLGFDDLSNITSHGSFVYLTIHREKGDLYMRAPLYGSGSYFKAILCLPRFEALHRRAVVCHSHISLHRYLQVQSERVQWLGIDVSVVAQDVARLTMCMFFESGNIYDSN